MALEVYLYIYYKCKTEEYPSFDEISSVLKLNKNNLRRITNLLSRNNLIYSGQPQNAIDKRRRVYLVENPELAENILKIYQA